VAQARLERGSRRLLRQPSLDPRWNYLVGEQAEIGDAKIVHVTTGAPCMAGHEVNLYADEWFDELTRFEPACLLVRLISGTDL
jgi:hypothetical protein